MSLTELKAQAQELGLTKEKVAEFGDLRKKVTWELAIADFQSQVRPNPPDSASMLEPANEVIGVSEVSIHEKLENSCMDADNSLAKSEPLQLPNKSALYDCHWVMIGDWVKLDEVHTCQVTHVLTENNVEVQVDETGEVLNVTPSRLRHLTETELEEVDDPEFAIADESKPESEIILTLFGLGLKVNDEHGKRCNEFVKLDESQIGRVTGIFTNNLVEIQLKT